MAKTITKEEIQDLADILDVQPGIESIVNSLIARTFYSARKIIAHVDQIEDYSATAFEGLYAAADNVDELRASLLISEGAGLQVTAERDVAREIARRLLVLARLADNVIRFRNSDERRLYEDCLTLDNFPRWLFDEILDINGEHRADRWDFNGEHRADR